MTAMSFPEIWPGIHNAVSQELRTQLCDAVQGSQLLPDSPGKAVKDNDRKCPAQVPRTGKLDVKITLVSPCEGTDTTTATVTFKSRIHVHGQLQLADPHWITDQQFFMVFSLGLFSCHSIITLPPWLQKLGISRSQHLVLN